MPINAGYHHPSIYGAYLSALVLFQTLTKVDVRTLGAGEQAAAGSPALDVYGEEPNDGTRWQELENVVLTPHLGGRAARSWDEARQMCAANVGAFLNGEPLVSAVPMN